MFALVVVVVVGKPKAFKSVKGFPVETKAKESPVFRFPFAIVI